MKPDDVLEQAESEHDVKCEQGPNCGSRESHIERSYIPRILRERLRDAHKEIARLRKIVTP